MVVQAVTKNYLQGEILAEVMITEKKFGQKKKQSTRNDYGRTIDQRGMNLAEKLINEEFHNKIVKNPCWSVFLLNDIFAKVFLVDCFFCPNLSLLMIISAKFFPH